MRIGNRLWGCDECKTKPTKAIQFDRTGEDDEHGDPTYHTIQLCRSCLMAAVQLYDNLLPKVSRPMSTISITPDREHWVVTGHGASYCVECELCAAYCLESTACRPMSRSDLAAELHRTRTELDLLKAGACVHGNLMDYHCCQCSPGCGHETDLGRKIAVSSK